MEDYDEIPIHLSQIIPNKKSNIKIIDENDSSELEEIIIEKSTTKFEEEIEYSDNNSDNKNSNFDIRKRDLIFIKNYLKKIKFQYMLKENKYHDELKKLGEEYDSDPIEIILRLKLKYEEFIDLKYFTPKNLKSLIQYSKNISETRIFEILNYVIFNNSKNKMILHLQIVLKDGMFKVKNTLQSLIIDYLINYLDPFGNIFVSEIYGKYNLSQSSNKKIDTEYFKLHNNILNKEQVDITDSYIFLKKNNKNLHNILNTTNSKIIDWLILNEGKWTILDALEKLLKTKDKILIEENDIIKILKLFIKKDGSINRDIYFVSDIIILLVKHIFMYALKIIIPNIDIIKDNHFKVEILEQFINILNTHDEKKIKYILSFDFVNIFIDKRLIWDVVLFNEKLTDIFISKGKTIPYSYLSERFKEKCVRDSFTLGTIHRYIDRHKFIRYSDFKKYLDKKTKSDNIAIFYKNICKFNLPPNDKIFKNFIKFIPEKDIIAFYKKKSCIEELIPYIIYVGKYDLLDKIFEEGIYDKESYVKNFKKYIINIFGNIQYRYKLKIGLVFKLYSSNKRYGVKYDSFLLKNIIKYDNMIILKRLISKNKNISINSKMIENIINEQSYYRIKNLDGIINYLKPYIKKYDKMMSNITTVTNLSKKISKLTLEKIIEFKQFCPDFKIDFNIDNRYDTKYDFDVSDENLIKLITYMVEENFVTNNNSSSSNKIFNTDFNSILNFICNNDISEKTFGKITELYNKYLKGNIVIKKNMILEKLYNDFYRSRKFLEIYTNLELFKHSLYSNTFIISFIGNDDYGRAIEFCLKNYPYLTFRGYNYLKSIIKKYKNKIENLVNNNNRRSSYYKNNLISNLEYYQKIIKLVPEKNIIQTKDLRLYIDLDKERPSNILRIKADLENYLFDDIEKTEENNILLDL